MAAQGRTALHRPAALWAHRAAAASQAHDSWRSQAGHLLSCKQSLQCLVLIAHFKDHLPPFAGGGRARPAHPLCPQLRRQILPAHPRLHARGAGGGPAGCRGRLLRRRRSPFPAVSPLLMSRCLVYEHCVACMHLACRQPAGRCVPSPCLRTTLNEDPVNCLRSSSEFIMQGFNGQDCLQAK